MRTAGLVALNLLGVVAFAWPFVLPRLLPGGSLHERDAPVFLLAMVVCLAGVVFLDLDRGIGPKTVALLGVLGAAMVALRLPGFVAGFSAMFIVVLVGGNAFGPSFGFLLGAVGTFASGLFIGGLGPWLPFQMISVGWVGLGAGLLPRGGMRVRIASLAAYGFVTGYLFGAVMNLWSWPFVARGSTIGWMPGGGLVANLRHYAAYYAATSAVWDTFRAVGNAMMVLAIGAPLLRTLDRAAVRMRLDVQATGREAPPAEDR
ncbi:MAG: ECF transporter S component [Actinobacteria bacterium]|nr:ECF transporter S component [Actinomycetota bacterium]